METLEVPRITRHRLNVEQYHRMAEAGVLEPDARVELIEGEVIDMAPIGSRHYSAVSRLTRLLVQATGSDAVVSVQQSLRLDRFTEPEPDISVLKPRDDFYAEALPGDADALLVIEVADSTVAFDLKIKARLSISCRHAVAPVHNRSCGAPRLTLPPAAVPRTCPSFRLSAPRQSKERSNRPGPRTRA